MQKCLPSDVFQHWKFKSLQQSSSQQSLNNLEDTVLIKLIHLHPKRLQHDSVFGDTSNRTEYLSTEIPQERLSPRWHISNQYM